MPTQSTHEVGGNIISFADIWSYRRSIVNIKFDLSMALVKSGDQQRENLASAIHCGDISYTHKKKSGITIKSPDAQDVQQGRHIIQSSSHVKVNTLKLKLSTLILKQSLLKHML